MYKLIRQLEAEGYRLWTEQEMTPLFDELNKSSRVVFLTRIQYEYYKPFYPSVKLYSPELIAKIDYEPNPEHTVLHINAKTDIDDFLSAIDMVKPHKVYYTDIQDALSYHTDVTLYEVLCDARGITFIKQPDV